MDKQKIKQQFGELKQKAANWFLNQTNPREKFLIAAALATIFIAPFVKGYEWIDEIFSEQQQRLQDVEMKQRALPTRIQSFIQLEAQKNEMERSYQAIHSSDTMLSELDQLLMNKNKIRQGYTIAPQKTEIFAGKYMMIPFKLSFDITDYNQLIELLYDLSVGDKPTIIRSITIQKASNNWQLRVAIELSGITQTK